MKPSQKMALALVLGLSLSLCGCSQQKAGVKSARETIRQNDEKRGNLTRPRLALDLITYRETDIAATAASILSVHLEETATELFMPVNIRWKNEHASGREALSYTQTMLGEQRGFLLLYTPELMLQDIRDRRNLEQEMVPVAMLAREPICFVVRTQSGFGTVQDLQDAIRRGQKLCVAGSTVSGGLDTLRFIHLLGLPEDGFTYLPCTDTTPVHAVLSGQADVACVPILQAMNHVDKLRRLTVSAAHETQLQLGSNWLCILAPAQLPDSNPDFWYNTFLEFSNSLLWKRSCSENCWINTYLSADEVRLFLESQRDYLSSLL